MDVHHDGDVAAGAVPRPRRRRARTPQGRAGLPQSAAEPCRPTTSPRTTLQPGGPASTTRRVRPAVPSRRDRPADVRSVRRRRPLGPRQPPGLGDLRERAARHVVAGLDRRHGSRRWRTSRPTSRGGTSRRWLPDRDPMTRTDTRPTAPSVTGSTMADRADRAVGVIGLGGLGSAAAYWLARRGVDVVGFEQFELGHVRGASHDHSRIIRRSYHTPGYVELSAGAYDAWAAVERESGDVDHHPHRRHRPVPAGRRDRCRRRTRRASTPPACRTNGSTARRCAAGGRRSRPAISSTTPCDGDLFTGHRHRPRRSRHRHPAAPGTTPTVPTCARTRR